MQTRLLHFVGALRDAGLPVTVAETLDATRAARVSGIERMAFRESLAATLVKDEADRPLFDAVFERLFAAPQRSRSSRQRSQAGATGAERGTGDSGHGVRREPPPERNRLSPSPRPALEHAHTPGHQQRQQGDDAGRRLAHHRRLQTLPFRDMSPRDVEECTALVAALAQRVRGALCRRQRAAGRGRLDLRRTLRRSAGTGGVPMDPALRHRQPGRPDLIALCDYSHSVATASGFLLSLLAPAQEFFRRVRLFAFVDRPVEVSVESGVLVPHDRLDLYARSDFGAVLTGFWHQYETLLTRNTVLLILGDARNNRRPPRADILGRMRSSVRELVWLNPELCERWDTGDSVMRSYARHCDVLVSASNVRQLYAALRQILRH